MIFDDISAQPESQKDQASAANFRGFKESASSSAGVEVRAKALNCPNCGAPILDGQAACQACGSGLMYEFHFTGSKFDFQLPTGAQEIPLTTLSGLSLDKIAERLVARVQQSQQNIYVYWLDVPMLISPGMTAEKAIEEWKLLRKQTERASLGLLWVDAVQAFSTLAQRISSLNGEQRKALIELYQKDRANRRLSGDFPGLVARPSFSLIEELMASFPGSNDAEKLTLAVTGVNELISQLQL
jgi:hypothetical protein